MTLPHDVHRDDRHGHRDPDPAAPRARPRVPHPHVRLGEGARRRRRSRVCEEAETRPNALTIVTGVDAPTARHDRRSPRRGPAGGDDRRDGARRHPPPDGTYLPRGSSWPAAGLPAGGHRGAGDRRRSRPPRARPAGRRDPRRARRRHQLGHAGLDLPRGPGPGVDDARRGLDRRRSATCRSPTRSASRRPARCAGVMLVLHGGAWSSVGPREARRHARRRRALAGARLAHRQREPTARARRRSTTSSRSMTACARRTAAHCRSARSAAPPAGTSRCCSRRAAAARLRRSPRPGSRTWRRSRSQQAADRHERAGDGRQLATAAFGADRLAEVSAAGSAVPARVLYAIGAPTRSSRGSRRPTSRRPSAGATRPRTSTPCSLAARRRAASSTRSSPTAALQQFYAREQELVAPLVDRRRRRARAGAAAARPRERGLRARFTCAAAARSPGACSSAPRTARRLGLPRVVGRGSAKRSSRGAGMLTVRLTRPRGAEARRRDARARQRRPRRRHAPPPDGPPSCCAAR